MPDSRHGPRVGLRLGLAAALVAAALLPSDLGGRREAFPAPSLSQGGGGANGSMAPGPEDLAAGAGGDRDAWLAAGYFRGELEVFVDPIDRDWLAGQGGEAAARPLAVQRLDAVAWKPVASAQGRVDLSGLDGEAGTGVAYAYHEISSPAGGEALLEVGGACPMKVWLNGTLVYARHAADRPGAGTEALAVDLAPGRNRLLVKLAATRQAAAFSLSLAPFPGEEGGSQPFLPRLRLLKRVLPVGGELRGLLVMPGGGGPGSEARAATLSARDGRGRILATTTARPYRPFSLSLPPGFSGAVHVALDAGGLQAKEASAFAGDAGEAARSATAQARRTAAALPAGAGQGYDARASLGFLADLLEGRTNAVLGSFDGALCAIETIPALAALGGGRLGAGRPWRLAYVSPIDASLQPYSLYLPPEGTSAGTAQPLLVLLHDSGESDLEAMARLVGWGGTEPTAVVVAPYGRGEAGWTGAGEDDLEAAMAAAASASSLDPRRLWLAGWGIGGTGALRWASLHPLSVAAVASFGGSVGRDEADGLRGSAVLLVAGKDDGSFTPEAARVAGVKLDRIGALAEVAMGEGGNPKEAWEAWSGGGSTLLLSWFGRHVLPEAPRFVELRAPSLRYGSAPFIRLLDLTDPVRPGAASLEVVDGRHLSLATENLASFALDLSGPGLASGGRILVAVDGRAFTLDAGSRPVFVARKAEEGGGFALLDRGRGDGSGEDLAGARLEAAGRADGGESEGGQAPHLGGGLADLFRSPLVVVYGTRRAASSPALRALALTVADWSPTEDEPFGHSLGRYPVMSDREAEKAGLRGKAILLVGGPADNRLAERWAPRLAVGLSGGVTLGPGLSYKGAGAVLVQPKPDEPARLIGVLSLPQGLKDAGEVVRSLIAPLRADPAAASMRDSWRTPDLVVFDRGGKRLWAAAFGPGWKDLRSWYQ